MSADKAQQLAARRHEHRHHTRRHHASSGAARIASAAGMGCRWLQAATLRPARLVGRLATPGPHQLLELRAGGVSIQYRIGDVFERLAEIPDGSVDLIVTSPPFLALRSYLPADHPDKHKEIGSETTPAEFIDTLLALTAEWGRVLAPHGSICVELGDTFSGSGGAGGDYSNDDGLRSGQATFRQQRSNGWPLAKSLTGIPTLYTWSLAYARNLDRKSVV